MTDLDGLFDWLLDGAPGASAAADVADRLGRDIAAAGVPLHRLGVFVQTLHPNVLGRAFIWERGKETRTAQLSREIRYSADYMNSPIAWCTEHAQEWRWRRGDDDRGYSIIADLTARGCVDYMCMPMKFVSGEIHVVSMSATEELSDEQLAAIRRVLRPLSRLAEILAMRRTATNILSTYVGAHSGERVMAGRIFKGDVETLRAAVWFSDLRGFTEMTGRRPAREVIQTLNNVFECQVPAIERCGGEVLKFIGDGLLAIFPISEKAPAETQCANAMVAARAALDELAALNARDGTELRIGLALHVGDVEYGNIGGAARLDFTAIGPAVNLASRLEGLTGKLGRPLVVSADFAAVSTGTAFDDLGTFELKGITTPQRVFGAA